MIEFRLTAGEWKVVGRDPGQVKHDGGFQSLLRDIIRQSRYEPSGGRLMRADRRQAERIILYSDPKYGAGTYQKQFRLMEPHVARELAKLPKAETASMFDEEPANV